MSLESFDSSESPSKDCLSGLQTSSLCNSLSSQFHPFQCVPSQGGTHLCCVRLLSDVSPILPTAPPVLGALTCLPSFPGPLELALLALDIHYPMTCTLKFAIVLVSLLHGGHGFTSPRFFRTVWRFRV